MGPLVLCLYVKKTDKLLKREILELAVFKKG